MSLRLAVLGSTGSVGRSALEVVRHHPERLRVETLAARGSRPEELAAQAREFAPSLIAVADPERRRELETAVPAGVRVVAGREGLLEAATHEAVDRVVAAIVGAAGLRPAWAALSAGKTLALANKESLVVAGGLLTRLARRRGVEILPIDSEHVALHQALCGGAAAEVERLVLTASGGPFRTRPRRSWAEITPAEAVDHPTWEMGAKISVDSATLMNKGLELIEASHLFGVQPGRIEVLIHPQSVVHSMVEFRDGSWLAQLSINDMVLPVQYALSHPERWRNRFPRLALHEIGRLEFEAPDGERFPSLGLARAALEAGPSRAERPGGAERGQRGGGRGLPRRAAPVHRDRRDGRAGPGGARGRRGRDRRRGAGVEPLGEGEGERENSEFRIQNEELRIPRPPSQCSRSQANRLAH